MHDYTYILCVFLFPATNALRDGRDLRRDALCLSEAHLVPGVEPHGRRLCSSGGAERAAGHTAEWIGCMWRFACKP